MKITKILGLMLAAASMMTITSLQAAQITGHISFSTESGTWTGDGGDVNTIEEIISFGSVEVDSTSGSFAVVASGAAVTMGEPLKFTAPVSIVNPFWSVGIFTFDLLSVDTITRTDTSGLDTLGLTGTGLIKNGIDEDTVGYWVWSGDMLGSATFTFSSTTVAAVPDGGITVMLLGAGLAGLSLLRRKFLA